MLGFSLLVGITLEVYAAPIHSQPRFELGHMEASSPERAWVELTLDESSGRSGEPCNARESLCVDAGELDVLGVQRPHAGLIVRWRNGQGAFYVLRIVATPHFSGASARLNFSARHAT